MRVYEYRTMRKLITRLRDDFNNKDFVLLFAYNGTGKTRISMAFKERGKTIAGVERDTLYFNAFTEDLFHWNNDLENDTEPYLIINSDSRFFSGFKELALEDKIREFLYRYADFDFSMITRNGQLPSHGMIRISLRFHAVKKIFLSGVFFSLFVSWLLTGQRLIAG